MNDPKKKKEQDEETGSVTDVKEKPELQSDDPPTDGYLSGGPHHADHDDVNPVHVIPLDDTMSHTLSMECGCYPLEDRGVIIHNAKDCRESRERITGNTTGKPWGLFVAAEYAD